MYDLDVRLTNGRWDILRNVTLKEIFDYLSNEYGPNDVVVSIITPH